MENIPASFDRFARKSKDVEAVLQRIGAGTFDLILIDADGNWERAALTTEEAARSFCERSQVPLHEGWDDPDLARRINSLDAWATPGAKRRAI
jgi:hypothetical protein